MLYFLGKNIPFSFFSLGATSVFVSEMPLPAAHYVSLAGLRYLASGAGCAERGCQQKPEILKAPYEGFSGCALERKRDHVWRASTFPSTVLWLKVYMGECTGQWNGIRPHASFRQQGVSE